ncbi:MAG: DNA-directed RNA polymerase subunit alpha C-terminal domain-containing protein [Clostridia bacterium]|nr:DNA-directed RNA polymerase subunit alpha C-terminal domain-containing protein [Clostridia bacterium]
MPDIRIADILKTEYKEFLEFCMNADKWYRDELGNADYVAFRSQYGFSREEVAKLREHIESFNEFNEFNTNQSISLPFDNECDSSMEDPAINEDIPSLSAESDVLAEDFINLSSTEPVEDEDNAISNTSVIVAPPFLDNGAEAQNMHTADLSMDSEISLSQFFSVEWSTFCDMPLTEADIGVRAYNCLIRGHKQDGSIAVCKTVGDLLRLSPRQISTYKNMGKLSFERIVSALSGIVQFAECVDEEETRKKPSPVNNMLKTQVIAMLHDEPFDISALNDEDKAVFSEYASAYDLIGKELALAASGGNEFMYEVIHMLQSFYKEPLKLYKRKLSFEQSARTLPNHIKMLPVEPLLFAYNISVGNNKTEFSFSLNSEATVLDFIHAVMSGVGDISRDMDAAMPFVRWLVFDETSLCSSINECLQKQKDKARFVFEQRMLGETLEAVGSAIGVTRERIRQIEEKVVRLVLHAYEAQKTNHDILAVIYALRGGDTVLRYDEIAAQIGDANAQIIWYLAKKDRINCKSYYFSHQSNAIVFGDETENAALASLLDELPAVIDKSDMPLYIADIVEKQGIPEELLRMQLRSTYKRDGLVYHRGRLTVVFMCDYILRTRFPNGYKIADESDQKRFMSYLEELFGKKGKLTARALDAKIGAIGVLIDRGKYIHPSYICVEKAMVDAVNTYIEKSSRTVLTYAELFDTFSTRFRGTQIKNRYCLQGVLKLLGCPFVMRKDYITKEANATLASEFEHYVEQNGRVHKSVLLDEFNGLSEVNIGFFCQRLTTIVTLDGGYYMHASHLDINEDDFNKQRDFLLAACSETPVSTRVLFNEYMMRFTDFMIRNNIETQGNLFGVLQYMFKQEFFFSRPYISLTDKIDLTHHGVLIQHLSGMDSIEIEDLIDICEKGGIHFLSIRTLLDSLTTEFIRVGKTMLMRKDLVGIDDDSILDTAQQINDIVHVRGGYCASKNIDDFSWFPELNIPWNVYLLESVSALAGDLITVLRINTSTIYTPVDVYIGDEYRDEDINSLIVRLLMKESQYEPFASKEEVFNWLQAQGLCNAKLPSFLETEGHLFYDECGKVKVQ